MKRMAIDTNIIIRILTGDDVEQSPLARRLITEIEESLYVFSMVIAESVYVLDKVYQYPPKAIVHALTSLFEVDNIEIEDHPCVLGALQDYAEKNVDFADALIAWKAKSSRMAIITWNKKHFNRLDCEFYSPEEIVGD